MPEPLYPGPPEGVPPPGAMLRATWPEFCEDVTKVDLTVFVNGAELFGPHECPVDPNYFVFYAEDYPGSTYTASVVGKTEPTGCEMSVEP